MTSRPLVLAGPTAVGKSEIAIILAELLGGEIISVDSMQVYCGMDVGTAKPSAADRARVPHHLVDVVEVSEEFDAAKFVMLARSALETIHSRGRLPILCGGTGLYFKAMLEGLGSTPRANPALRAELEATPLPLLLEELARSDAMTYARIDRQNPRRVVRAVEIIRLTGRPVSSQRADWAARPETASAPFSNFGFMRDAADLRHRIEVRVDQMFHRGLVAETESLLRRGLGTNRTAMQALGYRQVAGHLRGEHTLAETVEAVKVRTRQFARRQMTWFRWQMQLQWIQLGTAESPAAAAERVRDLMTG